MRRGGGGRQLAHTRNCVWSKNRMVVVPVVRVVLGVALKLVCARQ